MIPTSRQTRWAPFDGLSIWPQAGVIAARRQIFEHSPVSSFVTRGVALLSGNDCHGESDAAAAGFGLGKSAQAGAAGEQRHEHQHRS